MCQNLGKQVRGKGTPIHDSALNLLIMSKLILILVKIIALDEPRRIGVYDFRGEQAEFRIINLGFKTTEGNLADGLPTKRSNIRAASHPNS